MTTLITGIILGVFAVWVIYVSAREYFLEEDGKPAFKRGDVVSNGKSSYIVNAVFKDNLGKWKVFLAKNLWVVNELIVKYGKEYQAKDWYKVK